MDDLGTSQEGSYSVVRNRILMGLSSEEASQ